ncbi:MAG TPA: 5-formyltetrahydrofolate cyclo-ligase [Flexivirga sp.]|uniref:5-formyltetrahydrofolate cyclo-ligase n=1 Tax=Flexivirga sp. TaxID=1962927 RepID=UPI002B9A78B4|nr:5-formyltetrahydrofolate cyclo-ligase [Flexivirga sp.]HWC23013.1 5-formyltetrahydrofolate cyclo-ligase [Flexivirga sp.]
MSNELPANKRDARRRIRAGRRSLRASVGDEQWRAYGEALGLGLARWLNDRPVPQLAAIYEALPTEPPTHGIRAALVSLGVRLIVPTLLADNDLSWRDPASGADLGIAAISDADLILVPGLAVDRATGIRLGQGGGSYDRTLDRKAPGTPVLAVLFDAEVMDGVPSEPHDCIVDAVLTPSGGVAQVGPTI